MPQPEVLRASYRVRGIKTKSTLCIQDKCSICCWREETGGKGRGKEGGGVGGERREKQIERGKHSGNFDLTLNSLDS